MRPQESLRAARRPLATSAPRLDRRDEPRDVLRLVLEVAVHRHDDLAAGAREPGVHRRVLAEVALEADGAHARVAGVQPLDRRPRAVGRAVVDEDQLERLAVECRYGAPVELLERRLPRSGA